MCVCVCETEEEGVIIYVSVLRILQLLQGCVFLFLPTTGVPWEMYMRDKWHIEVIKQQSSFHGREAGLH